MSAEKEFSTSYYEKENEEVAFADYARYRYGEVEPDPVDPVSYTHLTLPTILLV